MTQECDTCGHTPSHCNCKPVRRGDKMSAARPGRKDISITLGGVTHVVGTVLPEEIIKRIADLNKKMRDDHRDNFVDEVAAIWDMCEHAFAAEFDAGYEHAQSTVKDWLERMKD